MRVVKASISAKGKNSMDIKISNGMRDFNVEIKKEALSYDDIKDNKVSVKVYSMIRNCCAACPIYVLESGKNLEEDNEIADLLKEICNLISEDIKVALIA